MEGGATCAAAVATWALVCMQGDVLVGKVALRSRVARRFRIRSRLAELVVLLVGITLLSTLRNDGCMSMKRVILLVSSVWVASLHPRNSLHSGCLHPRNSLRVGGIGRCCNVLETVGSCQYMGFCCLYDSLEVLCGLRISGPACHVM